jgi:hypothetical protein
MDFEHGSSLPMKTFTTCRRPFQRDHPRSPETRPGTCLLKGRDIVDRGPSLGGMRKDVEAVGGIAALPRPEELRLRDGEASRYRRDPGAHPSASP